MTVESMTHVTANVGDDLKALMLKAWQGEMYGVHVYQALADSRDNSVEAAKLSELTLLEMHVRDLLAVVLDGWGVALDVADVVEIGKLDVQEQIGATWSELMQWMAADAATALQDYLPLREVTAGLGGDTEDLAAVVIAHEKAISSFCAKELASESDSLHDVRSLLGRWDGR
ncbi:MAG: hypothetical protein ABI586_07900 [Candidatus Nanopelagicales bacterium]